jgi:hypothetical protein
MFLTAKIVGVGKHAQRLDRMGIVRVDGNVIPAVLDACFVLTASQTYVSYDRACPRLYSSASGDLAYTLRRPWHLVEPS